MKRAHFESLRPVCPRCLRATATCVPLELGLVEQSDGNVIMAGSLLCPATECRQEYPIIDGIPVLVPDVRGWVQIHQGDLLARRDLTGNAESLIGDCLATDATFNQTRHHVSIYAADHYGHEAEPSGSARPSGGASVHALLKAALDNLGPVPDGPVLDLGCSVGGTSFHLARAIPDRPVLGVDLSWGMLRLGRDALTDGRVTYSLRENGLVYSKISRQVEAGPGAKVDFWIGDALWPAFAPGTFGLIAALNLLDCVQSPVQALQAIDGLLTPRGKCILSTPYDWSVSATPVEGWIGGHSQRAPDGGRPEERFASLLAGGANALTGLRLRLERAETRSWRLRVHRRSTMEYATDLYTLAAGPADDHAD